MWKGKRSWRLSAMFSLLVYLTLVLTNLFIGTITWQLIRLGVLGPNNIYLVAGIVAVCCTFLGTVIAHLVGRHPLTAISAMNEAAKEVARGNFSVSLNENIKIRELRDTAHNFNIMVRELANTELLRTDFVESVSHEFKTPLSAIEGYAALLQKPRLTEEKRREYTAKILYNTRRLSTLTSNILLLSRLENQELDIPRETFCLDEQLREVILSQEEGWTGKGLELEIDLDSTDFRGSRDLLVHVWQNLLSNAVKFTPAGGLIRIRLRQESGGVLVSVADTGPGMSEEVQRRIFEKFYQGDPSRTSQGNGLGLALAKRIIDLHGGTIEVSSEEGRGTSFNVTLPM